MTRRPARKPPGRPPRDPEALTAPELLFCLEYLIDANGTRAYGVAYPKCKSQDARGANAARLLRRDRIRAYLTRATDERVRRLTMDGDEALAGITRHARGDIRRLFDTEGHLLPVHAWPDDIADCVRAVRPTRDGTAIMLYDKLRARELMAKVAGKLVEHHELAVKVTHADLLGNQPLPEDDDDEN